MLNTLRPLKTEVQTSLVLQVSMYYNAYFDVVYFFLTMLVTTWKISFFDGVDSSGTLLVAITVAWAVLEYLRLTLGYSGNLKESVGRTVTSLLLSFGSLGVAAFFLVAQTNVLPVDVALNGLFLVQVLVQILWLIYNARNFAHTQTTRFYLHFDRHGALLADREEEHRQRRRLMEEQQRQRQQQQRGLRRHPQQ